jgi:hypothetical protein
MKSPAKIGLTILLVVAGTVAMGALDKLFGLGWGHVVGWAIVAGLMVVIWLPPWAARRERSDAAVNVVLAEHALGLLQLNTNNPAAHKLGYQIVTILRKAQKGPANDAQTVERFNGMARMEQLGLVAQAMAELQQAPMLGDLSWAPFASSMRVPSIRRIDAARTTVQNLHGISVAIPDRQLRIEGGCLLDAVAVAPANPPPPPDLLRQAIYGSFAFFLEQTKDEKVDFNEYHLLILNSYITAISIPTTAAEPTLAMARLADLPSGWEQWSVSAIVDQLFKMVQEQIYK